ncbi:ABC transporter substrate-binding protein [Microbacterium soli]|uniref:ABC transporter substrate-binding protein n=2 Tax=Microbacterium soli TaxID=446075 RepID=A0ABP7N540_9MICO
MSPIRRAVIGVAPALLLVVALAGCGIDPAAPAGGNAGPAAADGAADAIASAPIDNCGTEVTVEHPAQRIIAIKSSPLELLLALGAGDRIIGSAFSDGPLPADLADEGEGIPVLSDKLPSRESVLALEPDLVFAGWESNFSTEGVGERDELQRLGVTTYVAPAACKAAGYMPDPLTFDAVFAGFEEAGRLVGERDAAADLVARQRAQLADIAPDTRDLTAVWYSSGTDQPYVGAGIGAPEMIMSAAGLSNVFADVHDTWTSTSWELVAAANPDVIVLVDAAWNTAESKIERLRSNPITAQLDAVREKRFLIVDFPATEAGIRNVDAVAALVDDLAELP